MINTPAIKVRVSNFFLTADQSNTDFTEAYLMAVDCRSGDLIRFSVYLKTGAIWSGLPIVALHCDRFSKIHDETFILENEDLQPYSCLEGPVTVFSYDLLKNAKASCLYGECRYLFTINYSGSGLAEDPEQHKTHNVVVLKNGQLAAFPNNFIRFSDNWFAEIQEPINLYKRNNIHYFSGG